MSEEDLVREIGDLKRLLREKENNLARLRWEKEIIQNNGLSNQEIARYSRQILIPEIGVKGQVKLKRASVLIVGAGGLGCPAALYLAGAGIGHIGIIDYDEVEINNLHRQLLYTSGDVGSDKVQAAVHHLQELNGNVKVTPYKLQFDSTNCRKIVEQYDVVIDATDNVPTRYLLNDVCVFTKKPLISGSALRMEGQLTVYNYQGPCYRCIFPKPPAPETVTNCGDGGVLGAVVGTVGVLQALEAIKIIVNMPGVLCGRLMLFDGHECTFRNVRLRSKNPDCALCGSNPEITKLIDYEEFCGSKANDKNPNLRLLGKNERISVEEYQRVKDSVPHLLIDVRSVEEFEICSLHGAINIPYTEMQKNHGLEKARKIIGDKLRDGDSKIYFLCRRGNDSQRAASLLKECFREKSDQIKDVIGGIHAWAREIDSTFPIY